MYTKMVKVVAVAGGTGGLGKYIVEALKKHPQEIRTVILSRSQTSIENVIIVDYEKEESLIEALKNVDYVVCALGSLAVGPEQRKLMQAAKKNNVKRFFPSEFGIDTSIPENQVEAAKYAKELGLPITRVMTGFFIDTFFLPWFGIDLQRKKASIVGDGSQPVSFTHRQDVGRLITHLILDGVDEEIIRTGTETKILKEAFELYENIKKTKLEVTEESIVEVKQRVKQAGTDIMAKAIDSLRIVIAEGRGWNRQPLYTGNLKDFITLTFYFSKLI